MPSLDNNPCRTNGCRADQHVEQEVRRRNEDERRLKPGTGSKCKQDRPSATVPTGVHTLRKATREGVDRSGSNNAYCKPGAGPQSEPVGKSLHRPADHKSGSYSDVLQRSTGGLFSGPYVIYRNTPFQNQLIDCDTSINRAWLNREEATGTCGHRPNRQTFPRSRRRNHKWSWAKPYIVNLSTARFRNRAATAGRARGRARAP